MNDKDFEEYFGKLEEKFEDFLCFLSMGGNVEITKKQIKQILEEIWKDGYNEGNQHFIITFPKKRRLE